MSLAALAAAVDEWAALAPRVSDAALERELAWRERDTDVRWIFYRPYEELHALAISIAVERRAQGRPASTAQRALALYHAAYRDLRGLLRQADEADFDRIPAAGEWPLRTVLEHSMRAEARFLWLTRYALERRRLKDGLPAQAPESYLASSQRLADAGGTMQQALGRCAALHESVLQELANVTDEELAAHVSWWYEADVRFQFGRFDAHLREHTIQAEKVLEAIRPRPSDALRTLRLIERALGEVEGATLGAPDAGAAAVAAVAVECSLWAGKVAALIDADA